MINIQTKYIKVSSNIFPQNIKFAEYSPLTVYDNPLLFGRLANCINNNTEFDIGDITYSPNILFLFGQKYVITKLNKAIFINFLESIFNKIYEHALSEFKSIKILPKYRKTYQDEDLEITDINQLECKTYSIDEYISNYMDMYRINNL